MSIYDDVKAEFGTGPTIARRADFTRFHGYAGGKVIGTFPTITDAKEAGAITTEKAFDDEGYATARDAYSAHWSAVEAEWRKRLMAYHSDVTPAVFDIAYSMAYDRGHSAGHGEVENILYETIDFAKRIIDAAKETVNG